MAKQYYERYHLAKLSDTRGTAIPQAYSDISHFYIDSAYYTIKRVNFNSNNLDFSPMYYKDKIVFCSNRGSNSLIKQTYTWDFTNYLDLYHANQINNEAIKIEGDINTKFHEGPITFNKTYDFAIFTRTNYYKHKLGKSNDGIHKLKLYTAKLVNGKWTNVEEFPFNNNQYSAGHPALSYDGKKLVFISDRPLGLGGTDLYITEKNGIGWSEPVNLGSVINTEGNEMFPYLDSLNNLYYASDGLPGLGGLDVFCTKYVNGTWQKPVNMGYPINSCKDDFSLITDVKNNDGYLTSSRNVEADDDIYYFKRGIKVLLNVLVLNSSDKSPIPQAAVNITCDSILRTLITDSNGKTFCEIALNKDFDINAVAFAKKSATVNISTKNLIKDSVFDVILNIDISGSLCLNGIITDKSNSGSPLSGAQLILTDNETNQKVFETTTSSDGKYKTCDIIAKKNIP